MNDETIDAMERDYVRGFNDGYDITGRLPELARQLSHHSLSNPWFEGFRDGRDQFVRDQAKEMRPSWLQGDRTNTDSVEPGHDRDAGHSIDRQEKTAPHDQDRPAPPQDRDQEHER
ncbi:MAG: hypothetical protein KDD67_03270 [Ignavibacteriae bacterium]|nr:hypothetical protein [Ignavibacteriota bacterium]MCB9217148.1 hypothetical protein [Ignavibacteria bacterium]